MRLESEDHAELFTIQIGFIGMDSTELISPACAFENLGTKDLISHLVALNNGKNGELVWHIKRRFCQIDSNRVCVESWLVLWLTNGHPARPMYPYGAPMPGGMPGGPPSGMPGGMHGPGMPGFGGPMPGA